MAALLDAFAGCGGGDEDFEIASGLYQVSTFEIAGTCKLDDALAPNMLSVGVTLPVAVTTSAIAVDVHVCGHTLVRTLHAGDRVTPSISGWRAMATH